MHVEWQLAVLPAGRGRRDRDLAEESDEVRVEVATLNDDLAAHVAGQNDSGCLDREAGVIDAAPFGIGGERGLQLSFERSCLARRELEDACLLAQRFTVTVREVIVRKISSGDRRMSVNEYSVTIS